MDIKDLLRRAAASFRKASWKRELLLAPLVMCALFLIVFGQLLRGDKSFADYQDNTYYNAPLFSHISRSFSRGDYPYRIDTLVGGVSLYDSPQFSLIYPFYFFRSGFYASPLEAVRHLHYVALFHILIAYFNCYVMLRVFRLKPLPSLLGASLFAFSPNIVGYSLWINILAPYSWFPLAVAGVVLILDERQTKVGVLLTALSLSLLILASPSQPLIHAAYMIAALYLFRAAGLYKRHALSELRRATKNLILAGALTFGLSAPVLVPVLLRTPDLVRFCGEQPPVVGFGKLTYEATLTGQLEVAHLAGTLLPYNVPSLMGRPFLGLGAVLLALFALFSARANWIIKPLFFVGLYALISSVGSHLGLSRVNYLLPLINKFREPDRHLFLFILSFAALAGFGFDYLVEALCAGYRKLLDWKHLSLAGLFLAALAASWLVNLPYNGIHSKWYLLGACALSFGLLLLLLPRAGGKARRSIPLLAAALILYSSLQFPRHANELKSNQYFETANLLSHQALSEIALLEGARNYRLLYGRGFNEQRWSMNASYYGLRSFQAYLNPMPYRQFMEFYHTRFYPPQYTLLLGARFYVCDDCSEAAARGYRFERQAGPYKLFVNDQALPRYALISRVAGVYEADQDFFGKMTQDYDFKSEAYVERTAAPQVQGWLGEGAPLSVKEIKEEYSSLNKIRLRVETDGRAFLLLNEYYDTAWKARVNKERVDLVKLNLNQIGVPVDKGSSLVELEYEPLTYEWLLMAQRLLILSIGLYILYRAFIYLQGGPRRRLG